ncbi:MAG: helix-turn-helix transcriptional regulator [Lachnospiraceae bacterium]|nr:helix-turn-helix transcriptional regulator [Lachnospiraceae bacterium]
MHVYEKVRAYIEQQGYKQIVIANKAGIPPTTFNAIMNGKRTMYADDLRAICLALNVSPELFIEVPKKVEL